jgi:hypothetical protein
MLRRRFDLLLLLVLFPVIVRGDLDRNSWEAAACPQSTLNLEYTHNWHDGFMTAMNRYLADGIVAPSDWFTQSYLRERSAVWCLEGPDSGNLFPPLVETFFETRERQNPAARRARWQAGKVADENGIPVFSEAVLGGETSCDKMVEKLSAEARGWLFGYMTGVNTASPFPADPWWRLRRRSADVIDEVRRVCSENTSQTLSQVVIAMYPRAIAKLLEGEPELAQEAQKKVSARAKKIAAKFQEGITPPVSAASFRVTPTKTILTYLADTNPSNRDLAQAILLERIRYLKQRYDVSQSVEDAAALREFVTAIHEHPVDPSLRPYYPVRSFREVARVLYPDPKGIIKAVGDEIRNSPLVKRSIELLRAAKPYAKEVFDSIQAERLQKNDKIFKPEELAEELVTSADAMAERMLTGVKVPSGKKGELQAALTNVNVSLREAPAGTLQIDALEMVTGITAGLKATDTEVAILFAKPGEAGPARAKIVVDFSTQWKPSEREAFLPESSLATLKIETAIELVVCEMAADKCYVNLAGQDGTEFRYVMGEALIRVNPYVTRTAVFHALDESFGEPNRLLVP